MSKATHQLYVRRTGECTWLYDVKTHKVYRKDGSYHSTLLSSFTALLLKDKHPTYRIKRINIQLENK